MDKSWIPTESLTLQIEVSNLLCNRTRCNICTSICCRRFVYRLHLLGMVKVHKRHACSTLKHSGIVTQHFMYEPPATKMSLPLCKGDFPAMIIDYHCCSVLDLLYRWYFTIVIRIMSQLMSPYSCYNLPPLHPKGCCQSVSSKLSRFPLCSSRAWLLLWLVPVRWLKMFWVPGMGTRLSRFGVFFDVFVCFINRIWIIQFIYLGACLNLVDFILVPSLVAFCSWPMFLGRTHLAPQAHPLWFAPFLLHSTFPLSLGACDRKFFFS